MSLFDGGQAFPAFERELMYRSDEDRVGRYQYVARGGMSLRDWFAGQAIAGAVRDDVPMTSDRVAKWAYACADAMLEARKAL